MAGEDRKEFDPFDGRGRPSPAGGMPNDAFPWYFNVGRQYKRENGQLNMAYSPTGKPGFHVRERFAPLAVGMRKKGNLLPEIDSTASSDFIEQRAEAVALLAEKKPGEALTLFTQLSRDETLSDFQRADTMEQAVECLLQLEQFDEAEGLAKQIESEPVSVICQMRLLKARGNSKELVEQFRDHDFSGWADDRKGDAYLLRGNAAYFGRGDSDELAALAKRDFEAVLAYAVTLPSGEVVRRRVGAYLEKL